MNKNFKILLLILIILLIKNTRVFSDTISLELPLEIKSVKDINEVKNIMSKVLKNLETEIIDFDKIPFEHKTHKSIKESFIGVGKKNDISNDSRLIYKTKKTDCIINENNNKTYKSLNKFFKWLIQQKCIRNVVLPVETYNYEKVYKLLTSYPIKLKVNIEFNTVNLKNNKYKFVITQQEKVKGFIIQNFQKLKKGLDI